jgi:hypothetical protein
MLFIIGRYFDWRQKPQFGRLSSSIREYERIGY